MVERSDRKTHKIYIFTFIHKSFSAISSECILSYEIKVIFRSNFKKSFSI